VTYDALLLTSFGGPEGPDEVMPFLERVTAGRGVPRERLEEVSHHYMALGGVSPINQQNRELLAALRQELEVRDVALPIYWGNRNSDPYFADVIREMHAAGHRNVLAIVTSAYSSYSGCRQYRENLAQALLETGLQDEMVIDKVRHYFDHPGFVGPFVEGLVKALNTLHEEGFSADRSKIFFTTHSIPDSMAETAGPPERRESFEGGAYVAQHNEAARVVVETAKGGAPWVPAWELVYQSRSGPPSMPWLEPDIGDAIRSAAEEGMGAVVVIPSGFVSDHVEVIWDLDNEAQEIADEVGLRFIRVATPGVHPDFVRGLVDLVEERVSGAEKKALSPLGPWADFCAVGCCPNQRRELPTVAEAK
jgi:protoporphyrin/coproporphyrin ferrochelatase